jgi:F-type H+-transporting ATPase subunit delta
MTVNGEQPSIHFVSVTAQRIARAYAEALYRAADQQGQANAMYEELDSLLTDLLPADQQGWAFFANPTVGRHNKQAVIEKLFKDRASPLFYNFLQVLNEHERLDLLRAIRAELRKLLDERDHILRVPVRTAVPLADDQRERLEQGLRNFFHMNPVLEPAVDPELLGGLVVRIGDMVYDTSVRTKLDKIRNDILARSSHEIQSRRDRFSSERGD